MNECVGVRYIVTLRSTGMGNYTTEGEAQNLEAI